MGTVNVTKNTQDQSVTIFDQFYNRTTAISQNDYEIVSTFFKAYGYDSDIADDFTSVFFQILEAYDITRDELLKEFQGAGDAVALTETVAYYLNGLRSKSTLVGVGVVQQPNNYAARNVVK
ncbi:MAG: hypothetical protein EB168_03555 [Euryarchaeota archaeon]|nr:hypothetical protein [Euryarchaeota archaeon]